MGFTGAIQPFFILNTIIGRFLSGTFRLVFAVKKMPLKNGHLLQHHTPVDDTLIPEDPLTGKLFIWSHSRKELIKTQIIIFW